MIRWIFWIATGFATLVAASFALSNRGVVSLALWPLPGAIDAPLYFVVLLLLLIGFLGGRVSAWLAYRPLRSAHRRRGRELDRIRVERSEPASQPAGVSSQGRSLVA